MNFNRIVPVCPWNLSCWGRFKHGLGLPKGRSFSNRHTRARTQARTLTGRAGRALCLYFGRRRSGMVPPFLDKAVNEHNWGLIAQCLILSCCDRWLPALWEAQQPPVRGHLTHASPIMPNFLTSNFYFTAVRLPPLLLPTPFPPPPVQGE